MRTNLLFVSCGGMDWAALYGRDGEIVWEHHESDLTPSDFLFLLKRQGLPADVSFMQVNLPMNSKFPKMFRDIPTAWRRGFGEFSGSFSVDECPLVEDETLDEDETL